MYCVPSPAVPPKPFLRVHHIKNAAFISTHRHCRPQYHFSWVRCNYIIGGVFPAGRNIDTEIACIGGIILGAADYYVDIVIRGVKAVLSMYLCPGVPLNGPEFAMLRPV